MSELPSDLDTYRFRWKNVTEVTMLILMGFTSVNIEVEVFIFLLFLAAYPFTLIGNLGLVLLVIEDAWLHTPMYYFLSVLSFLDACYSSVVTPKMLINFLGGNRAISFLGCATQIFFIISFGSTECFLLAAMAYDRYEAIYNPLLYSINMSLRVYLPLIIASYFDGFLHGALHTVATFSLFFCASNEIRQVFCDIPPLLTISCSDININLLLIFYIEGSIEIVTISIVLISYAFILMSILKMHSAKGRRKAFSTCGCHLTGVSIYHGTMLFMYMRPSSSYASGNVILSIFYTIIIPLLNTIIYSLRNKDVKEAMKEIFKKNSFIIKYIFGIESN